MDTEAPTLTITPDIWRLRVLLHNMDGARSRGLGIHLDGTHAVGTEGHMLLAYDHAGPAMPPTWRLEFLYPGTLGAPDVLEIPCALGLHAVETSDGRYALVRIYDCGEPFPSWHLLEKDWNKERGEPIGLTLSTVRRFLEALPTGDGVVAAYPAASDSLHSALVLRKRPRGLVAVVMPSRLD